MPALARPLCIAWLALVLGLLPAPGRPQVTPPPVTRVTLLQLNDVYQISPVDRGKRGGLARVATLRKRILAEQPNTLFVLGGDTLSPSVASNLFRGKQMVAAWNALGLDYAVYGNHEFDFGPEVLRERMRESRFTWLGANVIDRATGRIFADTPATVLREVGGIKVGILGVVTETTAFSSQAGAGVEFRPAVATAIRLVRELRRRGAQVVIALTHLPMSDDKALARAAQPDVIMGGHEHEILQSMVGRTPIFKVGSDARDLGRVDLNLDPRSGRLLSVDWSLIPVTDAVPPDPEAAEAIGVYEKELSAALDKPVGRTDVELDARQVTNRTGETNLADFIADTYRRQTGADTALFNGGSIRSNTTYGPGVLTRRDVLSILPFENPIVKIEVTGATIRAALEHGLGRIAEDREDGRFPQVSGIRYVFDERRPAGSRITGVTVGGAPLDDAKTYTLATNIYVLGGGDGYTMFRGARALITPEEGQVEPAVVISALGAVPSIAPKTDGRIQRASASGARPALAGRRLVSVREARAPGRKRVAAN